MRLDDFDYQLPPELIASLPASSRDASRLLLLDRSNGATSERKFTDFPLLLCSGDLLVLNDTRVIPARLFGAKESGGKTEIFLVRRPEGVNEIWECLIRSSKAPKAGTRIMLSDGVVATVQERSADGEWYVHFAGAADFNIWLERAGTMPLPPYIKRSAADTDRERYQTVFSREPGAVAAPTAGLHFTTALLERIRSCGVRIETVTLHVGLGTFMPVRVDEISEHRMHKERFSVPAATVSAIEQCRKSGGRVVAVGTTVARALESAAAGDGSIRCGAGETDIFIYPGYGFKVVDALLTNFHLPKSTLLMLVSAFAGQERVLAAYRQAVAKRFRFFSYGDAMFIS